MSDNAPPDLQKAFALHRQGDLAGAEELYLAILKAAPQQFDALHLLGVLHAQTGRLARAAELLASAIGVRPDAAAAQFNLGSTLRRMGRAAEALTYFDKAIALDARYADALFGRANALVDLGRAADALAGYDRLIALKPDHVEALTRRVTTLQALGRPAEALEGVNRVLSLTPARADLFRLRGMLLAELRQPHEALRSYDQAVALDPRDGESLSNRGNLLRDLGRLDEALASHDKAIAARPDRAELYNNRGATLAALRRFEDALDDYGRALAIQPAFAAAHSNRGAALREREQLDEALASYDQAIALAPDLATAHGNRGVVLRHLDRLDESLASHDTAVALEPGNAEAHSNRGVTLQELHSFDEALASFDRALALDRDDGEAAWNKAQLLLLRGDHEQGWPLYEARRRKPEFPVVGDPAVPLWRAGTPLAGRTILVHWEQGLGDTIQFCRYLSLLRAVAARVLFAPQRPLMALMRGLGAAIEIVDPGDPPRGYDLRLPLLSLPLALATTRATIPMDIPYLRVDDSRIERWRARLAGDGLRVGVCWQGNKGAIDRGRSFPLAELAALPRAGVRLISLQKGDGLAQLANLPDGLRVETLGEDFDAGPDAFLDSAAVLSSCDLVVTSDTAIAHLAGALGIATWVALKAVPDWRWHAEGRSSPWYPTMRLFRQTSRGDWGPVFREIASELGRLVAAMGARPSTPRVPVSWGEVIDKITILEIKALHLKDARARANVARELALLSAIADPQLAASPELAARKAALRTVNTALWDVEDALRRLEAAGRFDSEFVALARSVYRQNDERAAIKRQINELLASEIVEEKSYESY
jgi:tetratricopeptide (TPR) repeat protein